MKHNHKVWLAATLLVGAAVLTGCSMSTAPAAKPTPDTAQKQTVRPDTVETTISPSESPEAGDEETFGLIALRVDEKEIPVGALMEEERIYLPLEETGKALGWDVTGETKEEETQSRRSVAMEKGDSRISVTWISSDNTAKQITWQKDGLLIPVDTEITSRDGVVYVPAAFFETAMRVNVDKVSNEVLVNAPVPQETPEKGAQAADDAGNGEAKESTENK